jgi:5-methylcytosine-specific restriction protein A
MPTASLTPCRTPGCPSLIAQGLRFCAVCQPTRNGQAGHGWARYNAGRSAASRGYGSSWRRVRQQKLAASPLCEPCETKGFITRAIEVDHIVPRAEGGTDEFENLRSICHQCHTDKTAIDALRGIARRITRTTTGGRS